MAKKQMIIEKALQLFAERGIEGTSVQQITEYCGISKGAFYLYFKSKDELTVALIDYFMMLVVSDIDRSVRDCRNKERMLYDFYSAAILSFRKHYAFAKILINEQLQPLNEELLMKLKHYDFQMNESIMYMLKQLYGDQVKEMLYDLLICVKGLMRIYMELTLHYQIEPDIDRLVNSLVQKTDLLARCATIPMISEGEMARYFYDPSSMNVTKEQIVELIEQNISDVSDPILVESLELLKDNLFSQNPSAALIKGMIENIKHSPQCYVIVYWVRKWWDSEKEK